MTFSTEILDARNNSILIGFPIGKNDTKRNFGLNGLSKCSHVHFPQREILYRQ